ncbi:MAG: DUF4388 domain-containing protein [Deltaproteobacteria bacterium]|nr:DUF4388 domain-containing protein [Nannocystaceae bacterium]
MQPRKTIVVQLGHDALAMALWRRVHARREDFEVQLTRDVDAMLRRVDGMKPDAVVLELADLQRPSREVLRAIRSHDPPPRIVVVLRENTEVDDDALFAEGVDAIARAPVDVAGLIETIVTAALAEEFMRGVIGGVGVLDLVQMLCLARRGGIVRFVGAQTHGAIWLEDGEIVHATWGALTGMDALVQLTGLEQGSFRVGLPGLVPRRSIEDGWRHTLMNAACLADELRNSEVPTATEAVNEPAAKELPPVADMHGRNWQARYRELTELGLAAMRGGDLAGARRQWNEAKRLQETYGQQGESSTLTLDRGGTHAELGAELPRGLPATA